MYVIAFSSALSWEERFKSHCAIGNTYDMLLKSKVSVQPAGMHNKNNMKLNFPKPAAAIAVSKSAPKIFLVNGDY